jgi:hypothetical protein
VLGSGYNRCGGTIALADHGVESSPIAMSAAAPE